jgi:hypothetical protein
LNRAPDILDIGESAARGEGIRAFWPVSADEVEADTSGDHRPRRDHGHPIWLIRQNPLLRAKRFAANHSQRHRRFRFDPRMPAVIAQANATAVVMHVRTPQTMALDTAYADLFGEVHAG